MNAGRFIVACAVVLAVGGCVASRSGDRPKPLTQEEINEMAKAKTPDKDIIQKIKSSGTVYRLTTAEIAHLRDSGVGEAVIDFMLRDYEEAVRWQERERYRPYYDWYYHGPHWYWCWPPEVIVLRDHRH